MKKTSFILFAAVSMALITITSCGKYEEGPGFSLRSAKARVVNTWVIEKYIANGQDVTSAILAMFNDHALEFKSDDSYKFTANGGSETGTWSFDSKKEQLELLETGSTTKFNQRILRLTNKEMWLLEEDGTDKIEVHYKTK
jgi:hypothetical protein